MITDGSHNPPQGIKKSEYMMLSSKNVFDDEITFDEPRYLSKDDFFRENKRTMISEGDVLLTIVGTVGRSAVVNKNMSPFTLQRSVAVLHPKKDICDSRFLMYALRGKKSYIENRAKGVAQKGIYLGEVSEIDINVPDIMKQQVIVEKLDKVSNIIKLRKKELEQLENLVRGRFVELTEQTKTMPTRMGDIASYINGYAFKPTDWKEDGKPIIRIQNLNDALAKYNYYDGQLADKYRVSFGDVLVSWATHLEAYIWEGGDAWLNQHIFKVLFDKMEVDKTYFVYATEDALRQAFKNAHGFKPTMEHIKRSDFENATVKLPVLEVQRQFADFAHQVNKSKVAVQKALDEAQLLFDSLMQEYFG